MVFDDASISKYYKEVFILKWDDDEYIQTMQWHRKPPFARRNLLFYEVAQAKGYSYTQLFKGLSKTSIRKIFGNAFGLELNYCGPLALWWSIH